MSRKIERVREPAYEVIVRELGTRRLVHREVVQGRLTPHFTDRESILRQRIDGEDAQRWFQRTPFTEARYGRRD
jgi:hypothetical protein